eukprot:jgi/Tetstr1/441411/TSEL_029657.t1
MLSLAEVRKDMFVNKKDGRGKELTMLARHISGRERLVALNEADQTRIGLISMSGIHPGASLDTLVLEPLPIRLNHQTSWEVSIVWPKFAVLDNPDLPDLLVDLSMMHALQIVLHPSRMEAYHPINPGAAAHGERAVVPLQDAGQTMHTRAKGRVVALYPSPQPTAGGMWTR